MKKAQFFAFAILGIALSIAVAARGDDFKEGVAKVVRITGSAQYATVEGGNFQVLKLGQYMSPGAVIRTDKKSTVDVVIEEGFDFTFRPDPHHSAYQPPIGMPPPPGIIYVPPARQTVVRLMADTTLKIEKIEYETTGAQTVSHTEVDIQDGTIFFNVKKLTALSTFKMKTKATVASIRGSSGWDSWTGDTGMFSGSEEVNGTYFDSDGHSQSYTQIISEGQSLHNNDGYHGQPSLEQNPQANNCPPAGGNGGQSTGSHTPGGNNNSGNPSGN